MDISLRTKPTEQSFLYDKKTELEESHLEIIPFRFTQTRGASEIDEFQKGLTPTGFCPMTDDRIQENKSFSYAIFTPSGRKKNNEAIILLHGLNERTWEKYLTWAEYLTHTTGKAGHPVPDRFPYEPYPRIMGQSPCDPPLGKQTQGGDSERDELHLRQRSPQQPAIPKPVTLLRLGQRIRL